MGTRALTVFKDRENKEICVLYRQYDGYEEGHGKELIDFLKNRPIVNGIGSNAEKMRVFNGMGCLTASVIAHFKGKNIGSFYLYPPKTRDIGEEFTYTITGKEGDNQATISVQSYDNPEKTILAKEA